MSAPTQTTDPFRALAETTPDAIITSDAKDNIVYVNPAAERLLGYTAAELVGQPVAMIVPEHQREQHHAAHQRYVRTRKAKLVGSTVEVDVRRSDGTHVPVELSLGATGDEDLTVTALIRDISQRVRAERQAAAQIAVTSILSGPDSPDQRQRVVAALTAGLGWDVGVLWLCDGTGLQLDELWQADERATHGFAAACRDPDFKPGNGIPGRVQTTVTPVWLPRLDVATEFLRREAAVADGLRFGVVLPLVTEGEVVGVLELFGKTDAGLDAGLRDMLTTVSSQIAESVRRHQHAADLRRSNAELEQFASIVAHDLSDPLRTIAGFAELLQAWAELDPESAEYAEMIQTSAQRGQAILDSVLNLARIGSAGVVEEQVDLDAVVRDALVALDALISDSGASFEVAELPTVRGHAVLLGQVFQNLFANAIKFRREEPPAIAVSAVRDGDHFRVDVADNGRGIAPGTAVFEMFHRSGQTEGGGAGIGLAVCQKIIERQGGTIWFDSEPGRGTTFHFTVRA
jgi:PAS domain S-box-containing protein